MFEKDALHERGKALEDEFFHRVDERLRAKLHAKLEREEAVKRFSAATGIENEEVIHHLIDSGFAPASISALTLVPIVFVAWADGKVTPAERQIILRAALHRGVKGKPEAFEMLEGWLQQPPPESLWNLWREYWLAISLILTPTIAEMLHAEMLRTAGDVAKASGGYFGRGKVSPNEQVVLGRIAEAKIVAPPTTQSYA